MFRIVRTAISLAALGVVSAAAMAQTVTPIEPVVPVVEPAASAPRTIDERQTTQHNRIQQGTTSGELTHREAVRVRTEQRAVRRAERRANADGVVTAQEQQRIDRAQDVASRDIRRQKHDDADRAYATDPSTGGGGSGTAPATLDERRAMQRDRISQGKESGELTAQEAHRLRAEQRGVQHLETRANRDGVVTDREAKRMDRAQDASSRDIRRQKNDQADRSTAAGGGNGQGNGDTPKSMDERQTTQRDRISQGKESGELTAQEAHRLRAEQRGVEHLENRANRDGTVTDKEAKRMDRAQDAASKDIRRQKNDKKNRG